MTDATVDLITACFVTFALGLGAFVASAMLMRLLAVVLAMFGVDVEE